MMTTRHSMIASLSSETTLTWPSLLPPEEWTGWTMVAEDSETGGMVSAEVVEDSEEEEDAAGAEAETGMIDQDETDSKQFQQLDFNDLFSFNVNYFSIGHVV